jgi:adenine-specific DNA methylase
MFTRFGDYADVQVGVVTGCNDFFCLSKSDAEKRDLSRYTIPIITRSNQLKGLGIDIKLFKEFESTPGRSRLLDLSTFAFSDLPPSVVNYIRAGEKEELHKGYKCSIRADWWKVPSIWVPDGFMLRQIHKYPRIFVNEANATSTDTVHRIRITGKFSVKELSIASLNSATLTWGELLGRSYGGGVLELEPSEARSLPIPDPKLVTPSLMKRVSGLLENDEIDQAINLVDSEILIKGLGITKDIVQHLNKDWERLANRRLNRK